MKMNGFLGVGLVMVLVCSLAGPTRADDKAVKAILDKAIRALGGEEKLTRSNAISWKAKGTFAAGESESGFTGQVTVHGLDHFRSAFEGKFGDNPFKVVTVLSGDKGWRKVMNDSTTMDATALASEKQSLYLLITPLTLLPLKGKGYQLEVDGEEMVGKVAAVVLKGTGPDGKDFALYFDKKTGFPIKQVAKVTSSMGEEFTQERLYGDYKVFDGIKRPTKIVTKREGAKFVEEEITEFKIVNKVDPATFAAPK
jgi:hypothetical protein